MWPQPRTPRTDGNHQNLEEATKDSSLEPLRRRRALKHLDVWISSLQNCEKINFCCYNLPDLWYFVIANLGTNTMCLAKNIYISLPCVCESKKYFIFMDIKYSNLHSHGKTQKDGCIFKQLPVVARVEELGGVKVRKFTSLKIYFWIFLAVQRLRLCAPNARGMGFIPGREIKMPHAMQHGKKS